MTKSEKEQEIKKIDAGRLLTLQIEKSRRRLSLFEAGRVAFECPAALGRCPIGPKEREGDGRTPEGEYQICLVKEKGKYGRSLGLNYPNGRDAEAGLRDGLIDQAAYQAILDALNAGIRPPWGTALGGEIYIHEGGAATDWTQGCIALDPEDMAAVYFLRDRIEKVVIIP